jgi:hypothetical protein
LRDYIDRIFTESSKVAKKRERIQVPDDFFNKEMDAPVQAPKWTLGGYRGSLKASIQEAIKSIPGRVEQRQQRQQRPQQAPDEPPQEEPADETQTPVPAPQVIISDEPRSIPPIISSQTSTEGSRVATQSSTDEPRVATQPSSDELSQNLQRSLSSAKKKKVKGRKITI